MEKEYFELNLPKNGWMLSTIILAIIIIAGAVLFYVFRGGHSPVQGAIPANQAGQNLVSFLNANVNGTVSLENATAMSGIYQIDVFYQNRTIPIYTTQDGKYFIQSVIPIQ